MEDPTVNRVQDTLHLWQSAYSLSLINPQTTASFIKYKNIKNNHESMPLVVLTGVCSSLLLSKVDFILFLNKCDILKSKIHRGIPFKDYVTSYQGPETFEALIRCTFVPMLIQDLPQ